jgi:hypothetical protein
MLSKLKSLEIVLDKKLDRNERKKRDNQGGHLESVKTKTSNNLIRKQITLNIAVETQNEFIVRFKKLFG